LPNGPLPNGGFGSEALSPDSTSAASLNATSELFTRGQEQALHRFYSAAAITTKLTFNGSLQLCARSEATGASTGSDG